MAEETSSVRTAPVRSSRELRAGDAPPHPYVDARRLRVNAYQSLARTLTNYRLLALCLLVVDLVLVGTVVWQARQTRIVPYVVELDGYGNAVAFGPADRLAEPDRALFVHDLARWTRNVRTISVDREIQRHLVLDAYAYTSGRAVALLNRWYREHPPFDRAREGSVSVQVTSVLALSERERSWQVQWLETRRDLHGETVAEERWQALVTLALDPPDLVSEVTTNPLGVHVVDFDWTRLPAGETTP